MSGFFPSITNEDTTSYSALTDLVEHLYGIKINPRPEISVNINLCWPRFDLPNSADRYFISFHTEQIDDDWLINQAQKVYPKPIMLVSDGSISNNVQWPDNIVYVRWISWHHQFELLANHYGVCTDPKLPKYHISSLSFRYSQFKKFVTSWLLKNVDQEKLILTWHGHLVLQSHVHDYPSWATWLNDLDFSLEPLTFINWNDNFGLSLNSALYNSNWRLPPYTDALVNLTNETFNYSLSVKNDQPYVYPGPYLTEKTHKPLLAGRPFVAVGQYQTLSTLNELGFRTDFGWSNDYDEDAGDMTRIKKIFETLEEINRYDTKQLYELSLDAARHNSNHIVSGNLKEVCGFLNQKNLKQIADFLC